MNIEIVGRPYFYVPFTMVDLEILSQLSAAHYDSTCKAASQVGGFIYGWMNQVGFAHEFNSPPPQCLATWPELDICLKILEMTRHYLTDGEQKELAYKIAQCLRTALNHARTESSQWKATVEIT